MPKGPRSRFSEAEICRVLRAIKKTGVAMEIRIVPFGEDRPSAREEVEWPHPIRL